MRKSLKLLAIFTVYGLSANFPASAETIEEKATLCAACHGEAGIPPDPKFPNIWGQHTGYLFIQLKDLKEGRRKNEVMAPIVAEMSKDDMLAYAEYFAGKEWPRTGYSVSAEDAGKANPIEVAGQCTACHLEGYVGDSAVPRLAGQNPDYLTKTTKDFKTRERGNNAFMTDMLASFSDADIALMSRFTAGQ